jgi:hypothetical protein
MRFRPPTFAALVLALSGPAYAAGVLYTPPLSNDDGTNQQLNCRALNVSKKPHTVMFEILDRFGTVLTSVTQPPIAPGATNSLTSQDTSARSCRVTVTDGGAKTVKVTLCVEQLTPLKGCLAATVAP